MSDATVDPREVGFYTNLADTWWDPDGPFWPLHELNALRREYILGRLCRRFDCDPSAARPLTGLRILDVGCGGGILSEAMARLGATVTGVDVVEKNIRVARLHAEGEGLDIDYRHEPVSGLVADGKRFDVVLNMEVVEHVEQVGTFMADCGRLVDEQGVMFLATINRTPLAWLFAIVGAEYVLGWLPKGTHQYRKLVRPREVRAHLHAAGLDVLDMIGVAANPFNRTLRRTRSTLVNYMLMAAR